MNNFSHFEEAESIDMPSKKHSLAQTNLTILFGNDERFTPFVELSLDATAIDLSQFYIKAKDELVPDISVYLEPPVDQQDDFLAFDEMRVTKIPDLAIEVLSPKQAITDLLAKIKAYFALGVRSCWLVMPSVEVINIYSQGKKQTFDMNDTEVVDKVLDVHLPIAKVFRMPCH
ncbi:Uma2 family endonuclease [Candidatus Marithioploca araucensis]|uniref:Uma2 family endonuclease n=1 Tax=Candidatus Marithioploca araucensis TaxID=70273 RepID=A0ABT7VTP0_9GAMM|nr:Uma2 family endonuclease [Candidatus Marithioploca araucensis]